MNAQQRTLHAPPKPPSLLDQHTHMVPTGGKLVRYHMGCKGKDGRARRTGVPVHVWGANVLPKLRQRVRPEAHPKLPANYQPPVEYLNVLEIV